MTQEMAIQGLEASVSVKARTRAWEVAFIAAIGLLIAATEWVFAYKDVSFGIALALLLVIAVFTLVSALPVGRLVRNCADSLALIPLYILFTASLPWFFIDQQYLLPAVYSAILGLCLWHVHEKGFSASELGFSKANLLRYSLLGLLLGIPAGAAEYFIITPARAFPSFEIGYLLRDMVYMLFFVGLAEELLFRAIIQRALIAFLGWRWGLLGASLLFAVMHLTWRSTPELGFTFIMGLLLGFVYYKTKSLTAPIMIHAIGNTVLVGIMPYLFK